MQCKTSQWRLVAHFGDRAVDLGVSPDYQSANVKSSAYFGQEPECLLVEMTPVYLEMEDG